MPKLSIIIPVYKVEKYVSSCIESILNQTFTDFEVIMVDDGSPDSSGSICDEYAQKDNRIKVLHYENAGVAMARNRGLDAASGDFVTFIDSDDTINPSFLDNFSYDGTLSFEIQGLMEYYLGNESKNMVRSPKETKVSEIKDIYAESELNRLSRGPYCKLLRRDIIEKNNIRFPKGIQFGEDAIFVKRYLTHCNGKGRSIAAADYIYNHFPSQNSLTSKRHPGQMMYDVAKMDFELFEQLEQNWGKMSDEATNDFKYIRTLEFYQSICLYLTEGGHTHSDLAAFLDMAKDGLYQKVRLNSGLPITYNAIRFALEHLPVSMAVRFLKLFFKIKSPNL